MTTITCPGFHRHPPEDAPPPFCGRPYCTVHDSWPIAGDPIWCTHHVIDLRNQLGELPELYAALHTEATEGTAKPLSGRVSGSKAEPSPAPRIDDADELVRWLCDWEDTIRQALGDPAAAHVSTARQPALTEATRYLHTHLTRALALTGTDEHLGQLLGEELTTEHRKLLRKTNRDTLIHHLKPPCPNCDMRTLRRRDGEDHIRCTHCQTLWTETEYQRLVLILTSDTA